MGVFEWDASYLHELLGAADDREFLEQYLATFDMRVKEALQELGDALSASKWELVQSAAHKLKGAAAGVGGAEGKNTARQLVTALQDSPQAGSPSIEDIRRSFETLSAAARKEFL